MRIRLSSTILPEASGNFKEISLRTRKNTYSVFVPPYLEVFQDSWNISDMERYRTEAKKLIHALLDVGEKEVRRANIIALRRLLAESRSIRPSTIGHYLEKVLHSARLS